MPYVYRSAPKTGDEFLNRLLQGNERDAALSFFGGPAPRVAQGLASVGKKLVDRLVDMHRAIPEFPAAIPTVGDAERDIFDLITRGNMPNLNQPWVEQEREPRSIEEVLGVYLPERSDDAEERRRAGLYPSLVDLLHLVE